MPPYSCVRTSGVTHSFHMSVVFRWWVRREPHRKQQRLCRHDDNRIPDYEIANLNQHTRNRLQQTTISARQSIGNGDWQSRAEGSG